MYDHQQQEGRLLQGVLNAQTAEDMNIVRVIFGGQPVYSSWNGHQVMASLDHWRCASHVTVLCHGQKLDRPEHMGLSINGGTAKMMVDVMENPIEMDDDWGYAQF